MGKAYPDEGNAMAMWKSVREDRYPTFTSCGACGAVHRQGIECDYCGRKPLAEDNQ